MSTEATGVFNQKAPETIIKLRPTLYIGLGGTGAEVLLRIRRRILNASWGDRRTPVRVENLADFPVAQFIHFDLDQGFMLETGKSQREDLLSEMVKLQDDDKLVEPFAIEQYSGSDDDLARYPNIEAWSPLIPKQIREAGINVSAGAGQIRAISRLYFFDKFPKVKDKIQTKLSWLKASLSKDAKLKALGLDLDTTKFRIVVIGSTAGGTGSGSFLDMGWLAKGVADAAVNGADVDLILFMPTGYKKHNKARTEANGYAAAMELETAMRGGSQYVTVSSWSKFDRTKIEDKPFDEVYIIDSGNVAQEHTSEQEDVYDMVADALFEDFASGDFANKKRSAAVNQRNFKLEPFSPPIPEEKFGRMNLNFFRGFSSFGESILDTQDALVRDMRVYDRTINMLKAFFGVGAADAKANRATEAQRDEFMRAELYLAERAYTDFPDFSAAVDKRLTTQFPEFALTDHLLADAKAAASVVAGIGQSVDGTLNDIVSQYDRKQWADQVREKLALLERNVVRDQDSTADVAEDRVGRRANQVYGEITESLRGHLYDYLDNKDYGGLEYVLSLVEQVKDRLGSKTTGMICSLESNARRYADLRDAVKRQECERLLGHLEQTRGVSIFGNSEKQAREIVNHLKKEIANFLKFHVRARAATEAAAVLTRVSGWLGVRASTDEKGQAEWTGLVGEFQQGRNAVLGIIVDLQKKMDILGKDQKKAHTTYIRVPVPGGKESPAPDTQELRKWADEAFKDFGGSRKIFAMLRDVAERGRLIAKLRNKADTQLTLQGAYQPGDEDPLVLALKALSEVERKRLFEDWLSRAMPWVNANFGKEFRLDSDQFKCIIGVGRREDFQQFRDSIVQQIPPRSGLTADQVEIVDTGVLGRAACYCELSGFPLTVLRGLEDWRAKYRQLNPGMPIHTHRDPTKFTHPISPSTVELTQLAEDLEQFLLAIMLGVLQRDTNRKAISPGQYMFDVAKQGEPREWRNIGNERYVRLEGLSPTYRQRIVETSEDLLSELSGQQLAALARLALYYESDVYKLRLIEKPGGVHEERRGFSTQAAGKLRATLREQAIRKGLSDEEVTSIGAKAATLFARWTELIPGSDADVYEWEVNTDPNRERRKRVINPEFLDRERFTKDVLGYRAEVAEKHDDDAPPPLPTYRYHVEMNGKATGPFTSQVLREQFVDGRITAQSRVWRKGLKDWQPISAVPELADVMVTDDSDTPPPLTPG